MFAFAIWDDKLRRLFCARDRAGEKPFYYTVVDGRFVFASELKGLLPWPGFRRELDYTAIADYLTFGFVPDPKSVWEGTREASSRATSSPSTLAGAPERRRARGVVGLRPATERRDTAGGSGSARRSRWRRPRCRTRTSRSARS